MSNIFDGIQETILSVATATFGYPASWLPSSGGSEMLGEVLYKDATAKIELAENDYNIEKYSMEFHNKFFPGLFDSVAAAKDESVKITFAENNIQEFWVKRCEKLYDGKTIKAYLQPK